MSICLNFGLPLSCNISAYLRIEGKNWLDFFFECNILELNSVNVLISGTISDATLTISVVNRTILQSLFSNIPLHFALWTLFLEHLVEQNHMLIQCRHFTNSWFHESPHVKHFFCIEETYSIVGNAFTFSTVSPMSISLLATIWQPNCEFSLTLIRCSENVLKGCVYNSSNFPFEILWLLSSAYCT